MALTKDQKKELVAQLAEKMKDAKSVIFADYQGLTVKDIKELRAGLSEKGSSFQVAKKTLFKIAAKDAGYDEELSDEALEGPVGAAFSMEDEMSAVKALYDFSKKNENLKLRGAFFEGRVLGVAETLELAKLPGRDELIAKFIYLVKSPISGFHGVLNNTISGFVRALGAIKEQKEKTA